MKEEKVIIAPTPRIFLYPLKKTNEVEKNFKEEFDFKGLFVNFLFHMDNNNPQGYTSIHWNFRYATEKDYDHIPSNFTGLDRMVNFYLLSVIPGLCISLVKPPIAIIEPSTSRRVEESFRKFGYEPVYLERRI